MFAMFDAAQAVTLGFDARATKSTKSNKRYAHTPKLWGPREDASV